MATDFSRNVLRVAIAQMCQNLGWNSVQSTAMEILTDVLERYICEIGRFSCRYAEQFGRTDANLDDLGLAIQEMGINLNEVEDYIKHVDPVPFAIDVPAFPVNRPSHLNFPKPNSRELREREEHIPPHLPPLNPGWNEEVYTPRTPSITSATSGPPQGSPKQGVPLVLPQGGSAEKRPFSSTVDGVSPVKKARILPDDVLHSHYEMKGVIMTTSGFLSPIKGQGKMPDARAPPKMPLYPVPPPTETESSGSEVRVPVDGGGDSGNRQKVAPVTGIVPSPKVKKNLSSFSKHAAKGTKSPRSPARAKSPGKSKSPKRGTDEAEGSKLKELLITGDSALDLTTRPGDCGSKGGGEYDEIPSSPEHELVIADDEDPQVRQRRLTSYGNTIDLVVRASREAILKEEDEERHHGKGPEALMRERQQVIEQLEKEKMDWFREQEQQIKQDIEVALQAKKQLEVERQQREHAQIAEKEREAHIDDTINDVIANATAEVAQIEDEESRRQKDVYEFDDDDFGAVAVARPSVALHPPKPNEKEPVKESVKDAIKDVASEKVKDVTKDSVSVSKEAKKSKSKKLKIKISSEAGVVKESGWTDDVVDIKEKLKQKLQMRGPSPEPPGGHVEDIPTFAISARPTVIKSSPSGTSSPSRIPAVSPPSTKADTVAPPGGDSGKDFFIAPIRIEKTTLTIKKEKGDRDRGREGHEHKKSKKKNKDKTKKHERSKEKREKEHSAEREERRKEKKRKKEERKSGKKAHQEEGKGFMIPKLTFKFGSGGAASSISVCRSDTPKVAPPAEPVKLVIRPPVAPLEVEQDIKPITRVPSPPPSPKSPVPVVPSPQPSPPPSLPPSPIRERSPSPPPSPPPPRRSPTPTPVFTPSPARSATPTFIPSLPDSPSPTRSPTRSPEHIILRSPSRSISPEPLSHSPVPTPSPSPPPRSPTPPPPPTPSPPPRSRSPSPSPPPKKPSPMHSPPRPVSPPPPSDSPKPILLSRPTLAARKAIPPSQRKKQAKGKRTPSATHIPPSSPPPPLPPTSAALAFQRGVISETQGTIRDEHGETIWICPACKLPDDGSPMIGCDDCPDWYHWVCVGIKVEPAETDNWYCPRCKMKQKKKKQRRKKSK